MELTLAQLKVELNTLQDEYVGFRAKVYEYDQKLLAYEANIENELDIAIGKTGRYFKSSVKYFHVLKAVDVKAGKVLVDVVTVDKKMCDKTVIHTASIGRAVMNYYEFSVKGACDNLEFDVAFKEAQEFLSM